MDGPPTPLPVDELIAAGRRRVSRPSMAVFFVPMVLAIGVSLLEPELSYAVWLWIPVFVVSFGGSWLWWSVTVPRWRIWAMERTDDPGTLVVEAIAANLIWFPGHWIEKTEVRSPDLRRLQARTVQDALARYVASHPDDEPGVRALLEPWLRPDGRSVITPTQSLHGGTVGYTSLLLGITGLVIVGAGAIGTALYDAPISETGARTILGVGVVLVLFGRRGARASWGFVASLLATFLGLAVCASIARRLPWTGQELAVFVAFACIGVLGFLSLSRMGRA